MKHVWSQFQTVGLLSVYFLDCNAASFTQGGDNRVMSVPLLVLMIMAFNLHITAESLPILPLLTHEP